MPSRMIFIVSVLCLFVFLSGCTRTYSVKPFTLEPELLPLIGQIKGPLSLINGQTPGTKTVFKSGLAIDWVGDLSEWTDQAIGLLAHELSQRNVAVSKDAAKKLTLSVISGKLLSEMSGVRCIITLKVTAGNGYTAEYEGNNINRASPFGEMARYYAGGNALTQAVIAMLNDEKLIRYLQE